jgi:hypothetical protein
VLALICFYLRHVLKSKRTAQKLFLIAALLCCLGRTIYFTLWPALWANSHRACSDAHFNTRSFDAYSTYFIVLGSLPAGFFLAAFSVNVFSM